MDADGSLYVAGQSVFSWVGPDHEQPLNPHAGAGSSDAFVLKLAN
jgi:hypothetical protein